MSTKCNTITSVLKRNGTDQSQRSIDLLNPNSLKLHDFGIADWMKFAFDFAKHVHYFGETNSKVPTDDWQAFFKDKDDVELFVKDLEKSNELTPHLTLFICFLKLLDLPKNRLNGLTKKHLDFFYGEVLKIEKLNERSDSAHILFELAKTFNQEKLEARTQLDGGKDALGKTRIYELDEEIIVNQAQVVQLKSVYKHFGAVTTETPDANFYIRSSAIANSYDGNGAAFPQDDHSWMPFGYYQNDYVEEGISLERPALVKAKMGFSISSPVLNLSEGTRYVQITIEFKQNLARPFTRAELLSTIKVYYTAKNGWIGPLNLHNFTNANLEFVSLANEKIETLENFSTSADSNIVRLALKLEAKDKPTSVFNDLIHFGRYNTEHPVFKFEIDVDTEIGSKIHEEFSKNISGMNIHVAGIGLKQLLLDSDHGVLNPTKPMYPFTQNPTKGSSVIINNAEIFNKKWSLIQTNIKWKNTPNNFQTWYEAYQSNLKNGLSKAAYLGTQKVNLAADDSIVDAMQTNSPGENYIVTGNDYFKAQPFIKYNSDWEPYSEPIELFESDSDESEPIFDCIFDISNPHSEDIFAGPIKLSLTTSFLHQLYPQLYALALTNESPTTMIPNQPYTPFAEEISVSYFAKETVSLVGNELADFEKRTIQIFHEHPFGQAEESDYLKSSTNFTNSDCSLLPRYDKGGLLFIGIKNVEPLQTLTLLIQLLEGSENPLAETFTTDVISWEILCSDHWKKLDSLSIVKNEIDNFLKTGIVSIKIPKEATKGNTQLDEDLFWIKAVMPKTYDAVCKVLDIKAQGAKATFVNYKNELSHLEQGIPANTISKLVSRSSTIKSVNQPFNSFNGKPKETDDSYYRRVSERLRHKQRAVMLWDYENIVLQEYTDIYKVKCLNHTNQKSFLAAGCVTLVVIPETKDKNMFNIYQPRVSTARLNEVKNFVSQLTSLHVKLDVINPTYEEIKIFADVKFYKQYDVAQYKIQLDLDLKQFLSPWAFDSSRHVEFGNTLHSSVLVDFIEKLYYVDYVSNIKMRVDNGDFTRNCAPSSPKSILVSSQQHIINEAETKCTIHETTILEEC